MEPFFRLPQPSRARWATGLVAAALLGTGSPALADAASGESGAAPWLQITPAPVRVKGYTFKPTCSAAPGTDPTYSFWFRRGPGDGLVVYFNGGGACWSDGTCDKPRSAGNRAMFAGEKAESIYKAELLPGDGPKGMGGILDAGNPLNPVRDWSVLFVSYCTGDVHSGSNTAHYRNPSTGQPFSIEHRGWDNLQVIAAWLQDHGPKVSRLLVSGSSAGAYGAATHYATLRALYPRARSVYLGDSGMGVSTPSFERLRDRNWNYQLPVSVFGAAAQGTPDAAVVARLAAHFPQDRFAQYTRAHDAVQTNFYAQMGAAHACQAWPTVMAAELAARQSSPNVRSYVAQGDEHTILRSPSLYSEQSGGQPFVAWLEQLLNGPMPANQACTSCLTTVRPCAQHP